jgi:hypothetical protein
LKQTLKKVNWLGWAQVLTVFALMLVPVFFSARAASAAGQLPVPPGLEAVPGLNNNKYTLNGLIIRVITWILAITLAVDVLFMIIGGFLYITSAGKKSVQRKAVQRLSTQLSVWSLSFWPTLLQTLFRASSRQSRLLRKGQTLLTPSASVFHCLCERGTHSFTKPNSIINIVDDGACHQRVLFDAYSKRLV